jgi:hypothetical protein
MTPFAAAIARHYRGLVDGFFIYQGDAGNAQEISALGMTLRSTQTVVRVMEVRINLTCTCLAFVEDPLGQKA